MPYGKYSSHSTSQCKDTAERKAKLSGGAKDHAEATNSWKKEYKTVAKQIKLLKKQNKQLMKIVKKSTSSKKEKKNLHKLVKKTKSISLDSSDSDSNSDWKVPRSHRSINIMDKAIDDNQNTKLKNTNHSNELCFSSINDIDTTKPLRNKELPIPVTTVDILKRQESSRDSRSWIIMPMGRRRLR